MKIFFFNLLFFFFYSPIIFAHGTVIIQGVGHDKGFIDVKIYGDDESFLKEDQAIESIRKKPTKETTIIPLSKVHEGKIAIVVYHDENNDGELNTGLFWRPKEGYAFSNNYIPKGPPSFSKAMISLVHGESIKIELNY